MAKYYCALCETSHHELVEGASCPECGRKYCLDSIKQSFQVGMNKCPYCDAPFEGFPEIPIPLKKILRKETGTETPTVTPPTSPSAPKGISTTFTSTPPGKNKTISTLEPNSESTPVRRKESWMGSMGMRELPFFMKNPMYIVMAIMGIIMIIVMIFFLFNNMPTMMRP